MQQIIARVVIDLDDLSMDATDLGSTEITVIANSPTLNNAVAFSASELEETARVHLLY